MLDWNACPAVERVSDRVSGAWVFKGTRVPVRALFENLEAGATVDDFLRWFPGVTRDQVLAVLAHAIHDSVRIPPLSIGNAWLASARPVGARSKPICIMEQAAQIPRRTPSVSYLSFGIFWRRSMELSPI